MQRYGGQREAFGYAVGQRRDMVGRVDDVFRCPAVAGWVMTRRMTHTAHHRGQLLALLRMLGREEHSNYGPSADTGGADTKPRAHYIRLAEFASYVRG
jgi:hypothetical protein